MESTNSRRSLIAFVPVLLALVGLLVAASHATWPTSDEQAPPSAPTWRFAADLGEPKPAGYDASQGIPTGSTMTLRDMLAIERAIERRPANKMGVVAADPMSIFTDDLSHPEPDTPSIWSDPAAVATPAVYDELVNSGDPVSFIDIANWPRWGYLHGGGGTHTVERLVETVIVPADCPTCCDVIVPPGDKPTAEVPEPGTLGLMCAGLVGLVSARKVCDSLESRRVRQ